MTQIETMWTRAPPHCPAVTHLASGWGASQHFHMCVVFSRFLSYVLEKVNLFGIHTNCSLQFWHPPAISHPPGGYKSLSMRVRKASFAELSRILNCMSNNAFHGFSRTGSTWELRTRHYRGFERNFDPNLMGPVLDPKTRKKKFKLLFDCLNFARLWE